MHTDSLKALQTALDHRFRDDAVLREALTHASFANEDADAVPYERLEFLGDAVVQLSVSRRLFERFADEREGKLTQLRARLVDTASLARHARSLGLGELLRLGRGEVQTGGAQRVSILADVLEAVIGAVFVDGGFEAAHGSVCRLVDPRIDALERAGGLKDHKSELQELAQARFGQTPTYATRRADGPDHDAAFEARVSVAGVAAVGVGRSKKAAEQAAAARALEAQAVEGAGAGPDAQEPA